MMMVMIKTTNVNMEVAAENPEGKKETERELKWQIKSIN